MLINHALADFGVSVLRCGFWEWSWGRLGFGSFTNSTFTYGGGN
jgi:hypothetical protein